ncbi:alpha-mannosidase [Tangfeifania diversioriginum]|uniref:Alpha-mannosidase n=1 Tax=Tangfeifania diversioriginum TaxID=1168035 RepID=A0A1M6MYA6_9BACT|nr:glycoside hydrolase family 38 C-terminal domain-containing protein [Tangfeifania diversioriginum]SHJ88418.1 alpha-mannosidase [Tangfeifania diversioriginum]
MKNKIKNFLHFLTGILMMMVIPFVSQAQKAWFADGYHGGVYGHYPMWQARFMVEKLTENPGWAINLEIEPETWDTVSVKDAENFKAFQKYYETKGRFGRVEFVNPAWAQPYCYNISGESIIRQFDYGMDKIEEYFPSATFETYSVEEPCFTSSLPQILKGFNFKYAVIRNPNTCWGGYTSGFNKDLVNWIGPDGTSLVSVPRYGCEDLSDESTWQTESWTNSDEFIEKCFNYGVKYPVGMCFQDAGWDGGPWNNEYEPTTYTIWTDYFEMIEDKVEPTDWRFSLEDVKPGLVWGSQVLQKIAQEVRVSENKIIMAEKMATLDFLYNKAPWPEEDLAEAWRTLMLAQHHDCWIVPYNGRPGNTWADKVTRWTNSTNRIAEEKISRMFNREGNAEGTEYIRVYNTHGSTRTEQAELLLPEGFNADILTIYNSDGEIVPSQVTIDSNGNSILCFEATVPGLGFSTFRLKNDSEKSHDKFSEKFSDEILQIETDFYKATISPSQGGSITSLIDKKNGNRQLVEKGKLLNNLKGFFYDEGKFHQGSENIATVSIVEDGQLFTKIKIENRIAENNYIQLVTFNKNNSRIDFSLQIDWNGQPGIGAYDNSENYEAEDRAKAFYNDKYKLHLEFSLNNLGERLFKNAPFDVCESELDNTLYSSWDSIKHNVIVNWVDVTDPSKDYGVALFSDHTTSYLQTDELPLGLTVQYVGKALWGRNYRIHGPTKMNYALLPHKGDWEKGLVQEASSQWNEPLIAKFADGSTNTMKESFFEIMDENLEVSSMTIEDEDLIVRFYNSSSDNKPQKIKWNCMAKRVEQVDLNGNFISEVGVQIESDRQFTTEISLPQFGFKTLRLKGIKIDKN